MRSVLSPERGILGSAALNTDGKLAVTGSNDGQVQFWDTQRARLLFTYAGHAGTVFAAAFGPKDELVLTAGGGDKTARLWDARAAVMSAETLRKRVRCEIRLELRDGKILSPPDAPANCDGASK